MQPPLPIERAGQAAPEDLLNSRKFLAEVLCGIETGAQAIRGAGANRILCFGDSRAQTLVVHFHGGGYRQGQPEMIAGYAARLAEEADVEVWCPAYRLAPEYPFPAALIDAMHVRAYVEERKPRRLVLAGDSAGGGLAAALTQVWNLQGVSLTGLVLHSPWLDLRLTSESYRRNAATDPLFSRASASAAAQAYLQGHLPADPLVSPLLADPPLFPRTFLSVGSGEVLFDEAVAFHARLAEAGRGICLRQVEGMDHVAVTRGMQHHGATEIFNETVSFLTQIR